MKKIIALVIVVAIVAAGFIIFPKVTYTCGDCGEFFFGPGYEPNVVEDFLSEEEQIICEGCAEEQHAFSIAMGKTLEDFKRSW